MGLYDSTENVLSRILIFVQVFSSIFSSPVLVASVPVTFSFLN